MRALVEKHCEQDLGSHVGNETNGNGDAAAGLGVNTDSFQEYTESEDEAHREYVDGEYKEAYDVHVAEDMPTEMADTNAF